MKCVICGKGKPDDSVVALRNGTIIYSPIHKKCWDELMKSPKTKFYGGYKR